MGLPIPLVHLGHLRSRQAFALLINSPLKFRVYKQRQNIKPSLCDNLVQCVYELVGECHRVYGKKASLLSRQFLLYLVKLLFEKL